MKLVVCLDKNNGIRFFHKRQSQDELQRKNLLESRRQSLLPLAGRGAPHEKNAGIFFMGTREVSRSDGGGKTPPLMLRKTQSTTPTPPTFTSPKTPPCARTTA